MAFNDQDRTRDKIVSAALSALFLAMVAYGLVNGFAYNAIKSVTKQLSVVNIHSPPPPPPPPPPPAKKASKTPPGGAPPPPAQTPPTPLSIKPTTSGVPSPQAGTGNGTAGAGAGTGSGTGTGSGSGAGHAGNLRPKGDPSDWVTLSDYTAEALKSRETGTTAFRLDVGPDGRVSNCTVSSSSGFADLDETTCRLLTRRGRFYPATDRSGTAIAGTYSGSVQWLLPNR